MGSARIAAWAAIFTLVPAVCAMAKPITITADTNLRSSPGTSSPVLTLIPKGTSIEVGKCSNGWCQTSFNGQDGYAIAQKSRHGPAESAARAGVCRGGNRGRGTGRLRSATRLCRWPAGLLRLPTILRVLRGMGLGTTLVGVEIPCEIAARNAAQHIPRFAWRNDASLGPANIKMSCCRIAFRPSRSRAGQSHMKRAGRRVS